MAEDFLESGMGLRQGRQAENITLRAFFSTWPRFGIKRGVLPVPLTGISRPRRGKFIDDSCDCVCPDPAAMLTGQILGLGSDEGSTLTEESSVGGKQQRESERWRRKQEPTNVLILKAFRPRKFSALGDACINSRK